MRRRHKNPSDWTTLLLLGGVGVLGYLVYQNYQATLLASTAQQIGSLPSSVPGNPAPGSPGYLQKAIGQ